MNDQEKSKYREWAKELRKSVDLKRVSTEIESKIRKLDVYKSSKTVMSYLAKDIEISLGGLFEDGLKKWFLPVVETLHATSLLVVPYYPRKSKLIENKFNILEPEIINDDFYDQQNKAVKLDIIFVPGLCFDKSGNRIGYGAGFYDNFLKLNIDSIKVGVCPKECLVDILPCDEWDEKVDMVITDE